MSTVSTRAPIHCDSCGLPASPEHIRDRMARLELATRYRPVHVGLLLVCTSPPQNPADDLYAWEQQAASAESRKYLEGLFQCVAPIAISSPSAQLAEFQRRGVYLARLVECPLGPDSGSDVSLTGNLAARYGPVLVKRIALSYKPRHIALLTPVAPGLPDLLRNSGFAAQLIADGKGIEIPAPDDVPGIAAIRGVLALADTASA